MNRTGDAPSRLLDVPVVPNIRHLGGLPLAGGPAQLGNVVRSGALTRLEPGGVDVLRELDIRLIVDLRTPHERAAAPEPELALFGIRSAWAPTFEVDPAPVGVHLEYGHAGYLWMYQNFLEYGRRSLVQLVQHLVDTDRGVLYHCSAGRDRTGLATAVLLSAAGGSDRSIIADHALSETYERLTSRGIMGAAAEQRMQAPIRAMADLLTMIRERWGSAEGYLVDAGASRSAVTQWRARASAPSRQLGATTPPAV